MSTSPTSTTTSTRTDRPQVVRTTATASFGLLALRLATGALLLVHGIPKLSDPSGATGMAASLDVPVPDLAGWLMILGEVGLGSLLVLGLATRVAGTLLLVQMAGVWLLAHAPQGFLVEGQINGENALLFAALGLMFVFVGAGRFSVDALLTRRR